MPSFTLSQDTKITIGTAVAVITVCIGSARWGAAKLESIESRIRALESGLGDKFNLAAASEQALRMALENPGFRVPDPRDPAIIIEVRPARMAEDQSKGAR